MFYIISAVWMVLAIASHFVWGASPAPLAAVGDFLPVSFFLWLAVELVIYAACGVNIIKEWARRPILLLGRYKGEIGPGFAWIDPAFHRVLGDVYVRDTLDELDVPSVQTKDNVPVTFVVVLTKRISDQDVRKYVVEVANGQSAVTQRALAVITEAVRKTLLDDILHHPESLYQIIRDELNQKVSPWGIQIKAFEIKEFKIADAAIQQAIAMQARAKKEAEAEITRAEAQTQIAQKLCEAAEAMSKNPDAWKLKGLEVLVELTRSAQNNTILVPSDLIKLGNLLPDMVKN